MSIHPAIKLFYVERPENSGKPWNIDWAGGRNAQHGKWGSIITQQERTADAGSPGQALDAKRELPIVYIDAGVGIEKLELIDCRGGRACRRGHFVCGGNELSLRGRQSRLTRGVLVFAAHVKKQTAVCSTCRGARDQIRTALERPSKIVGIG